MLRRKKRKNKLVVLRKQKHTIDKMLLFLIIGLTFFGALMVYNASSAEAIRDFGNKYYYLKFQMLWALIGLGLMFIFSLINYKFLIKIAPLVFFANIFLLIIILIPGLGNQIKGARRWLNLGFFSFQPTELIKLTFVIYLASWLIIKRSFWRFLFLISFLIFLIILEPDMGTAIIVTMTGFLVYYVSGAPLISFLSLGIGGFILGVITIIFSPYRKERLLTFFNPDRDPLGSSYHIRQILIALGSGGLLGLGLGQSRQKYEYLPEAATDSIFAIIAEEIGFIGSLVIIFILFMVVWRGLKIAKQAPDLFSKLLASGISLWLGIQIIVNLSAIAALIPLTGIPLPFISYGGSSLLTILIAGGILLNISKYGIIKK